MRIAAPMALILQYVKGNDICMCFSRIFERFRFISSHFPSPPFSSCHSLRFSSSIILDNRIFCIFETFPSQKATFYCHVISGIYPPISTVKYYWHQGHIQLVFIENNLLHRDLDRSVLRTTNLPENTAVAPSYSDGAVSPYFPLSSPREELEREFLRGKQRQCRFELRFRVEIDSGKVTRENYEAILWVPQSLVFLGGLYTVAVALGPMQFSTAETLYNITIVGIFYMTLKFQY